MLDQHPHAAAVLGAALDGRPAHAYLLHGPAGTGKRAAARDFAAALLARDSESARTRVLHGTHPDLTWVAPSGAHEMLRRDVQESVVSAASHTPFESTHRVFVLERADTMNDEAANALLKTLEEPPPYVVLLLLTDNPSQVLPTISSRCQPVRFDPLSSERLQERLLEHHDPLDPLRATACARLSAGDGALAETLAREEGEALRAGVERFVRGALHPDGGERGWLDLLAAAKRAGEQAAVEATERLRGEAELLPGSERRRHEREGADTVRRAERRARSSALDRGLRLAELWLRDMWCLRVGTPELLFAVDRREELEADAADRDPGSLRRGIELVADTRLRLALNVSEELALEALAYRLGAL
jgi:DNA polymerase III subunit delta'